MATSTSTSIRGKKPKLETVFGPITPAEDTDIRNIFQRCDEVLLGLAQHFGHERAGWEGTGLELTMMGLGQVNISSFVETCHDGDGSKCVSFCVELRPGWYNGNMSGERLWEVEAEIYADCQHKVDHGSMDLVYEVPVAQASTPIDAAKHLLTAVENVADLAKHKSIEHWLELATDKHG
jgi:hypothetical protein